MPPAPFSDTLTVSDTGKVAFQAWVDNGRPLGTVVDYQDMRKAVFEPVCLNCHDSNKSGAARNGAPSNVNWDTFEAARSNAARGNLRVQAGNMPPSGPLNASQKATFQEWYWLNTPSGEYVGYPTLSDSLFTPSCILCHSSTASNRT